MQVIDNHILYDVFSSSCKNKDVIVIPIFVDPNKHPLNNRLSLLYVKIIGEGDTFMLVFDHSEGSSLDVDVKDVMSIFSLIYSPNKKHLIHVLKANSDNILDSKVMSYLSGESVPESEYGTLAHHILRRRLYLVPDTNRLVPIVKHYDLCEQVVKDMMIGESDETSKFYNEIVIPGLAYIESSGIKVATPLFIKLFDKKHHINSDSTVFSEYNVYTSTGRPSNRHGGVNYAALNKEDGTRRTIITRYADGQLIMFDYTAYHIYLIADLVNYTFPKDISPHEYLGRQYFNNTDIDKSQYEESKKMSFQYLYGNIPKSVIRDIPFFTRVDTAIKHVWQTACKFGYVVSPISYRKIYIKNIEKPNPQKLWNYFIQLLETERNILVIEDIRKFIKKRKIKLILYLYDAFLFDYSISEGKLLLDLKSIIEKSGKYPTKISSGYNFHDMINVTSYFQG